MAFRATKTTSKRPAAKAAAKPVPSNETAEAPVSMEVPKEETRVEDFVGAPQPETSINTDLPRREEPDIRKGQAAEAPTPRGYRSGSPRPAGRDLGVAGGYTRRPGSRFGSGGRDQRFGSRPAGRDFGEAGGRDQRFGSPRGGAGVAGAHRNGFDRGDRGFSAKGGPASGWDRREFSQPRFDRPRRDDFERTDAFTPDIDVPTETVRGILDLMPEGHGFLRPRFTPSDRDVYISQSQIRRFLLRNGDMVEGQARPPKDNERYWGLLKVEKVNEKPSEEMGARPHFDDLTPIYPNTQLRLETGATPLSTRMIDLVAPIGFGQRGLIVSPPKAGKTTILKEIAAGIAANYPNVHLMAALIGERPEEVTDLSRSIKGEVLASNFDQSPPEQTRVAEIALDRAKRLVEMGHDVVVLLDSITRLARAYNLVVNPSGRTLSGGFDPAALYPAKKFLGAARCVEKQATGDKGQETGSETGGSLTVIGTALVETGSRMDDLIYEEFKGTGNMELHLSRSLQERRIFPAIDVAKSGTRHDELLLGEEPMKRVTTLRHMLSLLGDEERTMMLIERLGKTKSNEEFLDSLAVG